MQTSDSSSPSSRRVVLTLCLLALAGLILAGFWFFGTPAAPKSERVRVPAFSTPLVDGGTFSSADMAGKRYLVHFWAGWCPPCLPELPEILKLAEEVPELVIVGVSLDESPEAAKAALARFRVPPNFRVGIDLSRKIPESFGSFQYPETYWVGEKGELLFKWVGAQDWQKPELRELLKRGPAPKD